MPNVDTSGLPPEMQQRIADIISKAKAEVPQQQQVNFQVNENLKEPPAPEPLAQRPPSLMDHTIALRQEVHALRQELNAASQVVEAVGQAVGQLYATFQATTAPTDHSSTYSAQFQQQVDRGDDY